MKHTMLYCLLFSAVTVLISCTNNKKTKPGLVDTLADTAEVDTTDKTFDTFFNRFEADSVFQFSRIEFPVKVTTIEDDNSKTFKLIKIAEWKYHNNLADKSEKYIINKIKVNPTEYKVAIMIDDTGFHLEYDYLLKHGMWKLVGIEDSGD